MTEYSQNGLTVVEGELEGIDEELTNNLEIIAPSPVRVSLMEQMPGENGEITLMPVTHTIRTYVPMSIFLEMLRNRQTVFKQIRRRKLEILRSPENDGSPEVKEILAEEMKEVEQELLYGWIIDQILAVWKLTEKDMTFERLAGGLQHKQGEELFSRFFGSLIKSRQARDKLGQGIYRQG